MKGLHGMIRLSKWRLDEARKDLAETERVIERIDLTLADLADDLLKQQDVALDPAFGHSYGTYAAASITRRTDLFADREKAEQIRLEKQEKVSDAFMELKKFEILAERRAQREKEAANKRDQAEMDSIAIDRFARDQDT